MLNGIRGVYFGGEVYVKRFPVYSSEPWTSPGLGNSIGYYRRAKSTAHGVLRA